MLYAFSRCSRRNDNRAIVHHVIETDRFRVADLIDNRKQYMRCMRYVRAVR